MSPGQQNDGLDVLLSKQGVIVSLGGHASQVLRRCWPARLAREGGIGAAAFMGTTHDLASTGGRMFGIARLHVKIYDFALYLDAKQVGVLAALAAPCHPQHCVASQQHLLSVEKAMTDNSGRESCTLQPRCRL